MREINSKTRLFFSSRGELPWEVLDDEEKNWKLSTKQIVPFGSPKVVQVWENTSVSSENEEYQD